MDNKFYNRISAARLAVVGSIIVLTIFVIGTIWTTRRATQDTNDAIHSVSLLYLDELAGRREQVVASNLQNNIDVINVAIELLDEDDLSDMEHLQEFQAQMKRLFNLEKFAFVDTDGTIYTSKGTQDNNEDYQFDYNRISGPEISILNLKSPDKKVVIAVPVNLSFMNKTLCVCFMEIDMQQMLSGVSMHSDEGSTTFCNIYTSDGIALTNTVLGGLAVEDNLLEAMRNASYEDGYSYDAFLSDFSEQRSGVTSFTYNGIQETLSYVPIKGTDWLLTYLIRESVISDRISSVSEGVVVRSVAQSAITVAALAVMFAFIISQMRRSARLLLEKETAAAENRARSQELEQRLALQEELLEQERTHDEQLKLIAALSSDYWSVYFLNLDDNEGVCYQSHADIENALAVGEHFPYIEAVTTYANQYVTKQYRDEFLRFVQPEAIREALRDKQVISFTYLVSRHGQEAWEMARFAGVRHSKDADNDLVHNVGACFCDVDAETRKSLAQNQLLSDALATAEKANQAKTAFLSNMSHEIRTPMNAIIGLDNIALNDSQTPSTTRGYLEQIGTSAEHLLALINDILDMSRIESGRMIIKHEEFSFSKLLEAINTMFSSQCQEQGLNYQCHINGEVDDCYIGDSMKLRQVLINILGNAVKFTPEGGGVELKVERTAHFDDKSTLRFTISDTGIGMSEEFLPHIFDTFAQEDSSTTTKYGSSGLGLAITKNIVEMMNGNIEVRSTKGVGTTFDVTVTLDDCANISLDDAEIRPEEMCVLIVDNDPIAREHGKLVLEKAGIESELAESGADAIEMVRLRHARRDPYNLILVDWQMPQMDGVETTRRIRDIVGDESAIIILTAYRWDDVLEEALQAGVDTFIPKPLFAANLIEEFKDALRRKNMSLGQQEHKAELSGRRVLLAEDVPVNAEIMMMVLEMREIQSELAENGRIAVEKFVEHPAGYYDASLMDMRMPEMDGLEATKTIRTMDREDARRIPIIALTANAFDEDVQRSLQAGLNAHLSKPVQPDVLFETLEGLIED